MIKEFLQVLSDPRARFVLWGPAVISMLLFGYAATFELKHIPLAVLDLDHSQESRELVSRFAATRYFNVLAMAVIAVVVLPAIVMRFRKSID